MGFVLPSAVLQLCWIYWCSSITHYGNVAHNNLPLHREAAPCFVSFFPFHERRLKSYQSQNICSDSIMSPRLCQLEFIKAIWGAVYCGYLKRPQWKVFWGGEEPFTANWKIYYEEMTKGTSTFFCCVFDWLWKKNATLLEPNAVLHVL